MKNCYKPEGARINTSENQEILSSISALEHAMASETIVEGLVTLCDGDLRLHVDLGCAEGIIEPDEALYCRQGEERKDIAIITRVGKPVAFVIRRIEVQGKKTVAVLSRRRAQELCLHHYLQALHAGDLIEAKITHLESFGAFLDIGCGVSSLLSIDCISVSRISHPRERLTCGETLTVAIKTVDLENERIYVTLRELLGTWEENAGSFQAGQTVTGIIRSVESYGVFIELAPNLAGLAEIREECAEDIKKKIGKCVAVYIKSIVPERMKIKLILIDTCCAQKTPKALRYYIDFSTTSHLSHWVYSPEKAKRIIETRFE